MRKEHSLMILFTSLPRGFRGTQGNEASRGTLVAMAKATFNGDMTKIFDAIKLY